MTPLDSNHSNQALAMPNGRPSDSQMLALPPGYVGGMVLGGEGPSGPPGLTAAPTVSGLVQALKRRWQLALGLALAAALATVAAVFLGMPARDVVEVRF